ncbi:hypothetical protein [uncultured Sneathiella sp.]|jgi:hypothetical protein|uniref:hypothetical protein n=1 Tax=uncultured Sneathiella sp. TaxID=879315 RepID=UPI0030D7552D|tara:strand:- start:168 stop:503 length:336 start_codon:yes stop_codon:yes gene_type:complete
MSVILSANGEKQQDLGSDAFIEESAEAAYLSYDGEEIEANDNFPAHEILMGCIWRDTETSRARAGLEEESRPEERNDDLNRRGELDFSDERRGGRGFLDEEETLGFLDCPE